MITTPATANPDLPGELGRALLQRLANDLAVARALHDGSLEGGCQPCCWVTYPKPGPGADVEYWLHRLCPADCPHWHHQTEVFLA